MLKKISFILVPVFFVVLISACSSRPATDKDPATATITNTAPKIGLNVGDIAPNLELPDANGKLISLASLRGQLVLIDFWASWCLPCRAENPNLVRAYTMFKDKEFKNGKGFTIFSVSLDRTKESWLAGIQQDKLVWPYHVSDLKYWQSAAVSAYELQSIPMNFLVNGEGVIINGGFRGTMLEHALEGQLK